VGAASNQLTGFTQSINGASNTSVTYGYNANGDLLSDGLRSYAYDAEGRLAAATTGASDTSPTTRYAHNALGQRVFKTEPLYPPSQGDEADPGFMQSLIAFFTKLWSPATAQAEQLGYAYVYDEQGTLLAEVGSGGTSSAGQSQYIYLPMANGPMPIAAVVNGNTYAVHSDHLNTPRKLTNSDGQAVWQWSYSAFGDDKPTLAKNRFANLETTPNPGTTSISEVKFNLRYPGQYYDQESDLFYNYFRSYHPGGGFYTQNDPIGLLGGFNRRIYGNANPLKYKDPLGLLGYAEHSWVTGEALGGDTSFPGLEGQVAGVDFLPHSQETENSFWHSMRDGKTGQSVGDAFQRYQKYIDDNINSCTQEGLARALHAVQDSTAAGHRGFQPWSGGVPGLAHLRGDVVPSKRSLDSAIEKSKEIIDRYKSTCPC
jgi:RHS repeat-associated protein